MTEQLNLLVTIIADFENQKPEVLFIYEEIENDNTMFCGDEIEVDGYILHAQIHEEND